MPSAILSSVDEERVSFRAGVALGGVCLLAAALGLGGFIGLFVLQHRREWAVRVALGASRWNLFQVLARELRWVSLMALGIAGMLSWSFAGLLRDNVWRAVDFVASSVSFVSLTSAGCIALYLMFVGFRIERVVNSSRLLPLLAADE